MIETGSFFRHNIRPQHVDNPVPALPTAGDTKIPDDTWYPIERVVKHKKVDKKEYFLVKWLDSEGSQTWAPKQNVTQFAIDQYFVRKRNEAKGRENVRMTTINYESCLACVVLFMSVKLHV